MTLELPEWMLTGEYEWLTEKYIIENGAYPEKPEAVNFIEEENRFVEIGNFIVPILSTDEIKAGDILIFFDGDGEDIFYRFTEDDVKEYQEEQRSFLAHGVIVKPPNRGD